MERRKKTARIAFLLYLAAVLLLCFGKFSELSSMPRPFLGIEADKIVHFLMFLPFPVLFYMAFSWRTRNARHSLILALVILAVGTLVAAGTEFIQDFIPYRASDIGDFLADFLALCLSSALIIPIDLKKLKRNA